MTVPAPDPTGARPDRPPLLRIEDLAVSFPGAGGTRAPAVDGASLTVHPGQVVALVGESGCGKSVTALSVLGLLPRATARIDRGRILFSSRLGEVDLLRAPERRLRAIRGGEIAMIFQEPMTSLNPVYTVGDQIVEAVRLHQGASRRRARRAAIDALAEVGIPEAPRRLRAYPHQFSGGMRQRVMIAMALACRPRLLLADEPTTALDVTIQAQILALLGRLRREHGLAILLITHDMGVVARHADVVCVMYAGRIVECAGTRPLFASPLHPYTRALLACIPRLGGRRERLTTITQSMQDSALARDLSGIGRPRRAWWPDTAPPEGPASGPGGRADSELLELAPHHWVCVRREGPSPAGAGARSAIA